MSRSPKLDHRYDIALSFAGAHRDWFRSVARALEAKLGRNRVFFDEFHEHELVGDDAESVLQNLFLNQSLIVVVDLSVAYVNSKWAQKEAKAIRTFRKRLKKERSDVGRLRMLQIRLGQDDVPGTLEADLPLDGRVKTPEECAQKILERLALLKKGLSAKEHSPFTLADFRQKIKDALVCDMAIDFGTSITCAYLNRHGTVYHEPTLATLADGKKVVEIGNEAWRTEGREPGGLKVVRPLRWGVVKDGDIAAGYLSALLQKFPPKRCLRRRIIFGVPSGLNSFELKVLVESAQRAGATYVHLVESVFAAAIGCGLPVQEKTANAIIDFGAGTTESAIISASGLVISRSMRIGGDQLDEAIVQHFLSRHQTLVGRSTAEEVKMRIGSALPMKKEGSMEVSGWDKTTGMPKIVAVCSEEIRESIQKPLKQILESTREAIKRCPRELSASLMSNGIMLAGGGALLRGFDRLVEEELGIPAQVAEDPLRAAIEGMGRLLPEMETLKRLGNRM